MTGGLSRLGALGVYLIALGSIALGVDGCAVHIAPEYSEETADAIVATEKQIDTFYANLLSTPADQRTYQKFVPAYNNVEVQIRALILRCKIQPLNQDSTKMAETLLDLWNKTETRHKQMNGYSDVVAKIDQERFDGLLTAMALVEESKKAPGGP